MSAQPKRLIEAELVASTDAALEQKIERGAQALLITLPPIGYSHEHRREIAELVLRAVEG